MPTRSVSPAAGARALLDWLDGEAEAFSNATTREYYLNYAGLKDDLALTPIFERHTDLFRRDTVDHVLDAGADDAARAPQLREFVVQGYLDEAAKRLTEEIAARETSDSVSWEGEQVPYRAVQQRVMNEPDAARRHELDARRLDVTASQNPLREERWDVVYAQTRTLGFDSYVALCDALGALDLRSLRATMEHFLWDTEKTYRRQLERELRRFDIDPALAERSDLLRLFRAPQFDPSFPRERMLPALEGTLRGLGIDMAAQSNVIVDAEKRPRKSPRAFCAPARIPDEVYLVISPHGGHDDYRALFHEAGHAQHFAHIDRAHPFAFRGLGDNSVTEGFAFVLEHLLYSPAWLDHHLDLDDAAAYLSFVRFHKLYYLRRYAAKLLYEVDLHGAGNVRGCGKRYADLLTAHVGVRYASEDYLADLDDAFYCARYLRAWTFDAQLRAHFARRWGDAWFTDPKAASTLRELWSHGQRYRAEELLRQLGEPALDIAPLAEEVTEG